MALSFTKVEDEVAPVAVCLSALAAVAGASDDAGVDAVEGARGGTDGTEDAKYFSGVVAGPSEDTGALIGRSE